jgi:pyruvate formate lyase activating enzyme
MRPAADNPNGVVFDVKRFSLQDGPGIRTTAFFKGCPLSCRWCHNPESIRSRPEILYSRSRCVHTNGPCLNACPQGALTQGPDGVVIDRERCDGCGRCADVCPADALQLAGRRTTALELFEEVRRDRVFFDESRGGVTVSGGEPMQQPEFLAAFLALCRGAGLHTALDTCGFAPWSLFAGLLPLVDLFLYDLKPLDEAEHRRFTGVSNRLIHDNLRRLTVAGAVVQIRMPMVAGITDGDGNIDAALALLTSLRVAGVSLLNYHSGGSGKRLRLGLPAAGDGLQPVPTGRLEDIRARFAAAGLNATIGE